VGQGAHLPIWAAVSESIGDAALSLRLLWSQWLVFHPVTSSPYSHAVDARAVLPAIIPRRFSVAALRENSSMVLLAQDFSPQAGLRLDAGRLPPAPTIGVALAIDDLSLARQLRRTLLTEPGLIETADAIADVVITDRVGATGRHLLRLRTDLLETSDTNLIVAAVRLRAAGYRIDRDPQTRTSSPSPDRRTLSARERQVAELLVDGASNKVVARALDISVHTAKFHVTAILEKLSARNRADAVAIILREGLVAI